MRTFAVALFSCFVAIAAVAQFEPPKAPPKPPDTPGADPFVYYAHSYRGPDYDMAGLDDRISIHVQNFETLLKEVHNDCSGIVLFLDGMALKGLKPESCDKINGHVRYRLSRTADADDAWHTLLGRPNGYFREVSVSLGSDAQFSMKSSVSSFRLEVIPKRQFLGFLVFLFLAIVLFGWLCRGTAIIRGGSPQVAATKRPYSLSLFQMAWWFFLVIAAYVFIWLINDELNTITESVLALIGIGAATAIGATVIDGNKQAPSTSDVSEGFFRDVLSDTTGVSLHRFQMFIWTLVLGVIFMASVYKDLEMPQFSATLLGLMGISSGTYLGFKVPEKASTDAPAGTSPDAAPPAST